MTEETGFPYQPPYVGPPADSGADGTEGEAATPAPEPTIEKVEHAAEDVAAVALDVAPLFIPELGVAPWLRDLLTELDRRTKHLA